MSKARRAKAILTETMTLPSSSQHLRISDAKILDQNF
jgi:hypothetical protein